MGAAFLAVVLFGIHEVDTDTDTDTEGDEFSVEVGAVVEASLLVPPDGPDKAADDLRAEAEAEAGVK